MTEKMKDFEKEIDGLSLEQRQRIELLLSGHKQPYEGVIRRSKAGEPARLSYGQERLYFLHEFYPDLVAYNEASAYVISGEIHHQIFERCINQLFERHEVLRSTFTNIAGTPYQIIQAHHDRTLLYEDVSSLPVGERLAKLRLLMREAIDQPFDLNQDQLMRAHLYQLDEKEMILLLVRHHIISDGWSARQMIEEIIETIHALTTDQSPGVPQPQLQYSDYAEWEREWLQGDKLEKLLDFWRKELSGLIPLRLPIDFPYPVNPSFQGGSVSFQIGRPSLEAIRKLARLENSTLFMVLLAAYQVLLYRYSGQEDFAVGSPVAGRRRTELESLIGFFANNLVLRSHFSGQPTFREYLQRVRNRCLAAYDHQDLPFARLVEILNPERRMHRNPLFEVSFQLRSFYQPKDLDNLQVRQFDLEKNHSKFDLEMEHIEYPDRLEGILTYSKDIFKEISVLYMVNHFNELLNSIVQNPDESVSALNLLSEVERKTILEQWNQTHISWSTNHSTEGIIESWVARQPDALAVVAGNQSLTYSELNKKANQLSRLLRDQNVGAETLVALLLKRSPEMIISILATIKAGAAYLPLDPDYPDERLEYMLDDSEATILITDTSLVGRLKSASIPVILLDTAHEILAQYDTENLTLPRSPRSMVYMIYTSGSTGVPKGVMIEDVGLVNLALSMRETSDWRPGDRVLQFSALNFDISVEEIFGALCNGATLVLRTERMLESVSTFLDENDKYSVTIWDLPTAFWHLVTSEGAGQNMAMPHCLRQVISGGDRMRPDLTGIWKEWAGERVELQNFYGPTEISVAATWADLEEPAQTWRQRREVPIGRPLPNVRVYILDDLMQPSPIGMVGELYVGGTGVGRGYWRKPELTAQVFLPDPFNPGGRIYRTGDRARWLPDGQIEFTGRADFQVKIRGYRIELGEIESILRQHPDVYDCVVLLVEDSDKEKRLVAYVEKKGATHDVRQGLRTYLKSKLPVHMLPAALILLDKLPLTPGGKIDRKALPSPVIDFESNDYVAPRSVIEVKLVHIWEDVLGVPRVGVKDNFFELGGHSLLAMQMLARIQHDFAANIKLQILFENPTVAGLASELRKVFGSPSIDQISGRENGEI